MWSDVPTVEVNGTSLAYRELGQGEPIVFVHGGASDLRTWHAQQPAFAGSHRAIVYSRRYARPNAEIARDADDPMEPHVEDLVALLHALDAAPAHLVGHSWGGFIALLTAIRRPELVRSLVLLEAPVLSLFVSTPPRPGEILPLLLRRPRTALAILRFGALAFAPAQRAFRRGDDEAAMRIFGTGLFGKAHFEKIPAERKQQFRDNIAVDRAEILGSGFPPLRDDEVRGVRAPTLLLTGAQSRPLFHRLTDRLQELLPNVRRVEIPEATHLLHEENSSAVNAAIRDFVTGARVSDRATR